MLAMTRELKHLSQKQRLACGYRLTTACKMLRWLAFIDYIKENPDGVKIDHALLKAFASALFNKKGWFKIAPLLRIAVAYRET